MAPSGHALDREGRRLSRCMREPDSRFDSVRQTRKNLSSQEFPAGSSTDLAANVRAIPNTIHNHAIY